jgi:hypothetical protein
MGTDAGEHWVIALGVMCIVSVGAALWWRIRAGRMQREALAAVKVPKAPLTRLAVTSQSGGRRHDA